MKLVSADQPAWLLAHQPERRMPELREFYESYDAVENTPMPRVTIPLAMHRAVVTGPLEYRGQGAIQPELEVVKAVIAGVSTALNGCSRSALKMGELGVVTE